LSRAALLVVLTGSLLAGAGPAPVAGSSGLCEPLKATVHAQLQVATGTLVLQGVLEGTLGGTPIIGSSIATLTTPIQGIERVDNPEPTEGGSHAEVFDEAKTDPPRSIATADRGMFVPTQVDGVLLLVVNAKVIDGGSGELHYQATVDLATDSAVWQLSGSLCA
jgi:hypothetical protein